MEDYSEELHSMMIDDQQEGWFTTQCTDGFTIAEKIMSPRFVRNNLMNFATVSTQTLIIHQSGECLITEHSYSHSQEYWRRLLQPITCCRASNPAKYTISNHVSLFFKIDIPDKVADVSNEKLAASKG